MHVTLKEGVRESVLARELQERNIVNNLALSPIKGGNTQKNENKT